MSTGGSYQGIKAMINGKFLSRLPESSMSPGELSEQKRLFSKVIGCKQQLYSAKSKTEITNLAEKFTKAIFNPSRLVIGEKDIDYPQIEAICNLALSENRGIYIPDLQESQAIISGNTPLEIYNLFSIILSTVNIDSSVLRALPFKSIAVVPIVSGMDKKMPVDQYPRYGTITLYSENADFLYHQAGLPPLRMLGEFVGIAIAKLQD